MLLLHDGEFIATQQICRIHQDLTWEQEAFITCRYQQRILQSINVLTEMSSAASMAAAVPIILGVSAIFCRSYIFLIEYSSIRAL